MRQNKEVSRRGQKVRTHWAGQEVTKIDTKKCLYKNGAELKYQHKSSAELQVTK